MAATRYTVSATASYPAKALARKESAVREADMRAKGDRETVTVTTSSGKLVHTAQPLTQRPAEIVTVPADSLKAALVAIAQDADAEASQVPATDATAECGCPVEMILVSGDHDPVICLDLIAEKMQAEAEQRKALAAQTTQAGTERPRKKKASTAPSAGRRAALGDASATGWELLYDKPKQNCEVGRRAGKYALICKTHAHVHELSRLTEERAVRSNGAWCPSCTAAA